jgi:AcrR family transcriptional regulator
VNVKCCKLLQERGFPPLSRPLDPTLPPRLIAAATALFAERGFADTSMDAVGGRAGVTKGGVYFHFRSKEALFFAAVDHWRRALRSELAALDRSGLSGAGLLQRTLAGWLGFHFERPDAARVLRVLAAELRGRFTAALREDARDEQRALRARLREALTRGGRDGSLFAGDPALAAFLLAGALEGFVGQWLTSPQDAEPFRDPDALATALCAPYRTGAAAAAGVPPGDAGSDFTPPLGDGSGST